MSNAIKQYWDAFCATLPTDRRPAHDAYDAWGFGDSPAMADELGDLVRRGLKTATASLFWEYEAEDEPLPQIGQHSIILDGHDNSICIIETIEVFVRPFNGFDAQFAYDEGEGDRSLAYWLDGHRAFFSRACAVINRIPDESMLVVGERFRVVYPITGT